VSSIEVSLKYAVGPSGKCTKVIASSRLVTQCNGSGGERSGIRTRLFPIFVHDHKISEPPPRCPSRYFPHLKSPRFRSFAELCTREDPNEFIAELIRRACRLGRCRDKYFWWDRRVIGGGEVGGKRVRRYVGSGLSGGLLLCGCSGGGRGKVCRQERGIKLACVFECAGNILRQSFLRVVS
jgi:hypothetical protein